MANSLAFILSKGKPLDVVRVDGLCVHVHKSVPAAAVLLLCLGCWAATNCQGLSQRWSLMHWPSWATC